MRNFFNMVTLISMFCFSCVAYAAETPQPETKPSQTSSVAMRAIRSGDSLTITVWQHKDLSITTTVDEDGTIEYLFLGSIPVEGKTVADLKEILRKGISENYIVDPKIDITIDKASLNFFITGEVQKPGTYAFQPGMTVLQAIAMAGGFTDYASKDIKIVRKGNDGKEKEIKIKTKKFLRATDKREDSKLHVDDILVAGRAWW